MTSAVDATQLDPSRIARVAAVLLAPISPLATVMTGVSVVPVLLAALVFAAIALASGRIKPGLREVVLAVALIGQCLTFTAAFAGHAWQIDTHMLFFAVLAIIATTGSVAALATGVVLTAVHHLSFGLLLPALVYPTTDLIQNLGRTVLHAVIVLFEAAILFLSIRSTAAAKAQVEAASAELSKSAVLATEARGVAERAQIRAIQAAELTRSEARQVIVAVEQVSAVARTAADHAAVSQTLVTKATDDALASAAVIHRTRDAMESIQDSSAQISQIVELIDEIARRTDLLALNAAVESARAGDAGRGFAVVANEVRKLAQQSADATLQIRALVKESTLRVNEGALLVSETGAVLERITETVATLNGAISDIAMGAREQFSGLQQVQVAIRRIDEITVDEGSEAVSAVSVPGAAFRAA